jgi:tRNA-specific 2-thiouridylase
MCNNWLKFGNLWSYGKQLDADYIATGHYARILRRNGGHELHMAVDPAKDQSYVLYGIRRAVLRHLLFPIGEHRKEQIRALAKEAELPVFNKPDSQEICFIPDGDYATVVRTRRPERATAGKIVDRAGEVLAEHNGIEHFTVGQRKGLGFAAGERRFVLEIIPENNIVVVGSREECLSPGLLAKQVNWMLDLPPEPLICSVKIRYRSPPVPATVQAFPDQTARVAFAKPQLAVTPGQAAVFYLGSRVVGGGWIDRPILDVDLQA